MYICWFLVVYRVDPDSTLYEDLKQLKEAENMDHILLHAVFDDKFPYSPPFVRVVKPVYLLEELSVWNC